MGAFVIGLIKVKDVDKWAEYKRSVPGTLEPWGARLIFRGRLTEVFSGESEYTDSVIVEFPDQDSARKWYRSAAYQALIPLRNEAADMLLVSHVPAG